MPEGELPIRASATSFGPAGGRRAGVDWCKPEMLGSDMLGSDSVCHYIIHLGMTSF